ncbi:MAG: phospholipase D family protein [Planctomycetota bacterium]
MLKYFDTGFRGKDDCLGNWLDLELVPGIKSFRGQFGFFDFSALRKFLPTLETMVEDGGTFRLVIGANHGDPASKSDIDALLPMLAGGGDARLAIASFSNALFHPKTLHLSRADDTVVGVVGSANLTGKGLGHNVEAGVVIESCDLSRETLTEIASAIDRWFECDIEGVYEITEQGDVTSLEEHGLIVQPSTRRRLRSANRARGAVTGRGSLPVGWQPPRSTIAAEPAEVEGDDEQAIEDVEDIGRSAIVARWCKLLRSSDAQQVQPGTNPTGKLRLAKARWNIDQTSYFRDEFFGDENWVTVDRQGTAYEEVHVRFIVECPGEDETPITLRIDHAPHRVADQNNVPTVLGWGPKVGQWLRDNNQSGRWVAIEKDIDGRYWLSFQASKPEWAP